MPVFEAPLIPVYLDELWGSIFSFRGGKFFWKWPSTRPKRVSIWFGKPIEAPRDIYQVRQAVQDLGADAVSGRKTRAVSSRNGIMFAWVTRSNSRSQLGKLMFYH